VLVKSDERQITGWTDKDYAMIHAPAPHRISIGHSMGGQDQ